VSPQGCGCTRAAAHPDILQWGREGTSADSALIGPRPANADAARSLNKSVNAGLSSAIVESCVASCL
jgi:hypothetical protein